MAELIDGRSIADAIIKKLPARIAKLGRKPGIGVVLAGHDHASELYVRLKAKAAAACGIIFTLARFDAADNEHAVLKQIETWNADPRIDAMLVQLPLPKPLREDPIVTAVDPEKDVDGFHPVNTGRYMSGERTNPPGLIEGILRLIKSTRQPTAGNHAAVIARASVFTRCLAHALANEKIAVTITPPDGSHRQATLEADINIVAAGRPRLVTGDDLKAGCTIIDVGINEAPGGRIIGDVDRASAAPVAAWISPVPGGVGPMTIAMLLENTVRLAERNQS